MYITLVGLERYAGSEILMPNMELVLKKDLDNKYDDEAVEVKTVNGATVGYVANSVCTVARGTHSSGYIYEKFNDETKCVVRFIFEDLAIAELVKDEMDEIVELE